MATAPMVDNVKQALMITGDAMDASIAIYIDAVEAYMRNAGISSDKISDSPGVVAKGVNDLWNNGSGGSLSAAFMSLVTQLACGGGG